MTLKSFAGTPPGDLPRLVVPARYPRRRGRETVDVLLMGTVCIDGYAEYVIRDSDGKWQLNPYHLLSIIDYTSPTVLEWQLDFGW